MATSLPEMKFRKFLGQVMAPYWDMTWHEDKEISPGVPDLHYIPKGEGDFRVGWLELKAIDRKMSKSAKIKIEPSQHQYMRKWGPRMPIHFLIRVVETIYVIESQHHHYLANVVEREDHLNIVAVLKFHQSEIATVLPKFLREITKI